jgi:hypothetical protein
MGWQHFRQIAITSLTAAMVLATPPAKAAIVTYDVDALWANNLGISPISGEVYGTFAIDTDSDTVVSLDVISTGLASFTFTMMQAPTYSPGGSNSVLLAGNYPTNLGLNWNMTTGDLAGVSYVNANGYSGSITGTVEIAAPVPEPGTALLFGFALAGLIGYSVPRRRRTPSQLTFA